MEIAGLVRRTLAKASAKQDRYADIAFCMVGRLELCVERHAIERTVSPLDVLMNARVERLELLAISDPLIAHHPVLEDGSG